ncbi:MAG: exodeoxyribonuclease VII large subunit [Mariniblastus sp.]
MSNTNQKPNVVTVSQLTQTIKYKLNNEFPSVWVGGEISGMTRPSSGHIYMTLKDKFSQINAIIWRSDAENLKFELTNGLEVVCRGGVDVYPQRGSYQLIVRKIQPKGIGALELAFRQLHAKLSAEGLFDPSIKKTLPQYPKHIAVVTSPTGAAIRDFLQVLTRRWPNIRVTIIPAKVQGPGAANEIATGIRLCSRIADPIDVVVVTRGGGSVEDLWSFNEESVVRAIHVSKIPVISGVGHEIDVTLSDLAADVRALTPSEAAERCVPIYREIVAKLEAGHQRMAQSVMSRIRNAHYELQSLVSRPVLTQPLERIRQSAMELDNLEGKMNRAAQQTISSCDQTLKEMFARLNSLSPLGVLARGYSLTTDEKGKLVTDCDSIKPGDKITTRTANGRLISSVEEIERS